MKQYLFISAILIGCLLGGCGSGAKNDENNKTSTEYPQDVLKSPTEYPQDVLDDAQAHCKKTWTKRGVLQQDMYDYCYKEQLKGYEELLILESKNKDYPWISGLKKSIIKKWTEAGVTNWEMVEYSLRGEIDAFLDLEYGLKNGEFDKERYDRLYTKYFLGAPEGYWGLILFELKKDL